MRISSHQAQQTAINAMLEQQEKLSKVQEQVATGQRIAKPSDDPIAAAKIVNLRDVLDTVQQYQDNINAGRARLELEEGVLQNVTDILQRVRELAVMSNNDTQTNESREFIAQEVSQLQEALLGLANSTDINGEYMFAGNKSKFTPFTRNETNGFDYSGDDGQRQIMIGPNRVIPTGDPGSRVFRNIKDGNGDFVALDDPGNRGSGVIDPGSTSGEYKGGTYAIIFETRKLPDNEEEITYKVIDGEGNELVPGGTPYQEGTAIRFAGVQTKVEGEPADGDFFVIRPSMNQDVFTTIQRFIDALRNENDSQAQANTALHNEVNRTLIGMDNAMGRILDVRADVGARLNAMDGQQEINESQQLQIRETLSEVEDLDYAKAVSDLNLRLTGLEASQKAYTRVQGISLFNHI